MHPNRVTARSDQGNGTRRTYLRNFKAGYCDNTSPSARAPSSPMWLSGSLSAQEGFAGSHGSQPCVHAISKDRGISTSSVRT